MQKKSTYFISDQNQKVRKQVFSIGKASEHLGVSIDTLRRWGKRGKINIFRSPGGHRYFTKADLDALFGTKYEREPSLKSKKEEVSDQAKTHPSVKIETQEIKTDSQPQIKVDDTQIKIPKTKPIKVITETHPSSSVPSMAFNNFTPAAPPPGQSNILIPQITTQSDQPKPAQASQPQVQTQPAVSQDPPPTSLTPNLSQMSTDEKRLSYQTTGQAITQIEKEVPKSSPTDLKKMAVVTVTILVIAFAIFLYYYSQPKILSPIP